MNPLSSRKDLFPAHKHVIAVAVPIGGKLVTSHSGSLFEVFSVTLHLRGLALYRRVAPDMISHELKVVYVYILV